MRARKVANIERTRPDLIATGNIGCMTQIQKGTAIPMVHTVELLDWATGGPIPEGLEALEAGRAATATDPGPANDVATRLRNEILFPSPRCLR